MKAKSAVITGAICLGIVAAAGVGVAGYMGKLQVPFLKEKTTNNSEAQNENQKNQKDKKNSDEKEEKTTEGEIVTYENFDVKSFNNNYDFESYDEVITRLVYGINNMDYSALDKSIYSVEDVSSGIIFQEMEGKVVSTQVIEEYDNYRLYKFVLDIKNPGKTLLKKGENIKYCYVAKAFLYKEPKEKYRYLASPFFDNKEDIKGVRYFNSYDHKELEAWGESLNAGFGFSDENYYYATAPVFNKSFEIDLNNDGVKETLLVEKKNYEDSTVNFYINKGKDNEVLKTLDSENPYVFFFYDLDKTDNYLDIVLNDDPGKFYKYDGKTLKYRGSAESVNSWTTINGDKTIDVEVLCQLIGWCYYTGTCDVTEDDIVYNNDQWLTVTSDDVPVSENSDVFITKESLVLYKEADTASEQIKVEKGTKLFAYRVKQVKEAGEEEFRSGWVEWKLEDGTVVYMREKNLYIVNGEDMTFILDMFDEAIYAD